VRIKKRPKIIKAKVHSLLELRIRWRERGEIREIDTIVSRIELLPDRRLIAYPIGWEEK
jgi:hypothetical protein